MYEYRCTVLNVVDGDTIDCIIDLGFHLNMAMRLRLWGINAPEKSGTTIEQGLSSMAHLKLLVFGKPLLLQTLQDGTDKYGRMLAVLYEQNSTMSVNQKMLNANKAIPYMVKLNSAGNLPQIKDGKPVMV